MKKIIFSLVLLTGFFFAFTAFTPKKTVAPKLKWLTWQEAVELNKTAPRKFIVDVYTDWCGWCKRMDKTTFEDDSVVNYLNKNFYCVKLNAEMHETIEFQGQKFDYVKQGSGGVHTFAASLLDGNMSYPTVVYLTQNFERVIVSPGYKEPKTIMPEMKYVAEEIFKTKTWKEYSGQ